MQTFIVKVAGNTLTPKDIREAVWVSGNLSREEISVQQQ